MAEAVTKIPAAINDVDFIRRWFDKYRQVKFENLAG